jgi:chromosome segregation protein
VLGVLAVDDAQRAVWEPRLRLYRDAVTVPAAQGPAARQALAGLPGAVLVLADADSCGSVPPTTISPTTSTASTPPRSTDDRFPLAGFVAALAERAGPSPSDVDAAAGLMVLDGATSPVIGRAVRVQLADDRYGQAVARLAEIDQELARARTRLEAAADRVAAAAPGRRATELEQQVANLRELGERLEQDRDRLHRPLQAAEAAHAEALGDRRAREDKIQALRAETVRLRDTCPSCRPRNSPARRRSGTPRPA